MKIFVLAIFLAVASASDSYTASNPKSAVYAAGKSYSSDYPSLPYEFYYAVKDEPSYNDYKREEVSDGNTVSEVYRTALPDGRIEIVKYKADGNGYFADVQYEGYTQYPEYKAHKGPAYTAYNEANAYPKETVY